MKGDFNMSNIAKKFISFPIIIILFAATVFILPVSTAHADELENTQENIGVSYDCPDQNESEIGTYSTSKPTSTWNVKSKGQYNFKGTSIHQTLYTNYKFNGKTGYTIYVKNTGSHKITVKAKSGLKTYASTSVGAGKTATLQVSGMSKSTSFYISFSTGNSYSYSFSGYIK